MTITLAIAGTLAAMLAVAHSLLGEILIFRRLSTEPDKNAGLSLHQIAVLRGTWHLLSLFGCGFAAVLLMLALGPPPATGPMVQSLAATFLVSGLYWLWATRGRHPAWIVLGAIGLLCLYALDAGA
jgi:hypothetical protein